MLFITLYKTHIYYNQFLEMFRLASIIVILIRANAVLISK